MAGKLIRKAQNGYQKPLPPELQGVANYFSPQQTNAREDKAKALQDYQQSLPTQKIEPTQNTIGTKSAMQIIKEKQDRNKTAGFEQQRQAEDLIKQQPDKYSMNSMETGKMNPITGQVYGSGAVDDVSYEMIGLMPGKGLLTKGLGKLKNLIPKKQGINVDLPDQKVSTREYPTGVIDQARNYVSRKGRDIANHPATQDWLGAYRDIVSNPRRTSSISNTNELTIPNLSRSNNDEWLQGFRSNNELNIPRRNTYNIQRYDNELNIPRSNNELNIPRESYNNIINNNSLFQSMRNDLSTVGSAYADLPRDLFNTVRRIISRFGKSKTANNTNDEFADVIQSANEKLKKGFGINKLKGTLELERMGNNTSSLNVIHNGEKIGFISLKKGDKFYIKTNDFPYKFKPELLRANTGIGPEVVKSISESLKERGKRLRSSTLHLKDGVTRYKRDEPLGRVTDLTPEEKDWSSKQFEYNSLLPIGAGLGTGAALYNQQNKESSPEAPKKRNGGVIKRKTNY